MNMLGTLTRIVLNPYVVGGSLALIGASFYAPGYATMLDRKVGPLAVRQWIGWMPLAIGAGVILAQVRGLGIPLVSDVAGTAGRVVDVAARPVEAAL
jgi:hypothetical protein